MFEAYFNSPDVLKHVLDAIKEFLGDGATFNCNRAGIQVQGIDKSHILFVLLQLYGFKKYRCDRDVLMRMNLAHIAKTFKNASSEDTLMMTAHDNPDTVKFIFESSSKEQVREYEMKLLNLDEEHEDLCVPNVDYACTVRMPSKKFERICKDLSEIGEQMVISCARGGVFFSATEDELTITVKVAQNLAIDKEDEAVIVDVEEPLTMRFSMKFLYSIVKATPLCKQVQLSMSVGTPLLVEYEIPDRGYIRYYLADLAEQVED